MNKILIILLLFLQIGIANGASIEVIGADATWSSAIVSGPNPTVSDRIIVYDANALSKFDVVKYVPNINRVKDRIIIYGANAMCKLNLIDIIRNTGVVVKQEIKQSLHVQK
jgi:hypothetical protein